MYDTIIIGTGSAGKLAARTLVKKGKKVAIIDNSPMGGTCALRGCQPKKFFVTTIHAAAETHDLLGKGVTSPAVTNWSDIQKFKSEFTSKVSESTYKSLQDVGIDCYNSTAVFNDAKSIAIENGQKILTANSFLVATGAAPVPLTIKGSEFAHTSDDFLELQELPKSIVFIGGGYISLEFAFMAALAGSKVTVLQKRDAFLPSFPQVLLPSVIASAKDYGIQMLTGVDVSAITENSGVYSVSTVKHGKFDAVYVMAAIGRAPAIKELNLDGIGVKYTKKGITTDSYMQTSVEGIYAAGDCVPSQMLVPVADMESTVAVSNILHNKSKQMNYNSIPSVVFTYPQLASVGLTSTEAEAKGQSVIVKSGSGNDWMSSRRLQAKHVYYETVTDAQTGKLLGAHIVSPHAGDIINVFALAVREGLLSKTLKNLPWAYPTYTADIVAMF